MKLVQHSWWSEQNGNLRKEAMRLSGLRTNRETGDQYYLFSKIPTFVGRMATVANVNVGQVVVVPHVNESGLRSESDLPFMVREAHVALWNVLDTSSCLVDGPAGSGKSTAVWVWLLERVRRTGNAAIWVHFTKVDNLIAVVIKLAEEGYLVFSKLLRKDPFGDNEVQKMHMYA